MLRKAFDPIGCCLAILTYVVLGTAATAAERGCAVVDDTRIAQVCYVDEPGRPVYGHGVLGATPEWDDMVVHWRPDWAKRTGTSKTIFRTERHVFEDIAPRLVDVDGIPGAEIVAVRSNFSKGAQLIVFGIQDDALTVLAETPYIGTRNRWLAPAAVADLDGDGHVELAYVDRPHLAKTLRVWRYKNGQLNPVANLGGVSNHRIGEAFITGGVRDCGTGPEIILADARWTEVLATRLKNDALEARSLGRFSFDAVDAALACKD